MAQYGSGDQYVKEGHQSTTNEYAAHNNPLQSTTVGHEIGGTGTAVQKTHGHEHGGKHEGGILHRSGSGSSSSSEDDGEGGRRKKKGVMEKIKEKLPGGGGDHGTGNEYKTTSATAAGTGVGGVGGGGYGYDQGAAAGGVEEGHEKKGIMEKIKEKLPGGDHH